MALSDDLALKIANGISEEVFVDVEFLYDGASSRAWKVTSPQKRFVVRMSLPDANRPVTYQSELELFRRLKQMGVPVPVPIATYKDKSIEGVEAPWAVTELVEGHALDSAPMTSEIASDLGAVLAKVHSLPTRRFGRLEETSIEISGKHSSPLAGVLARYCYGRFWPFDESVLTENAAYSRFSAHADHIQRHKTVINQITEDRNVALVHSDLHGKHIFVEKNQLRGLIDFGAAFIGVPHWEFGRLGFEFGWQTLGEILKTYESRTQRSIEPTKVHLLSLVFTLYKLDRYVRESSPEAKIQKGLNFLNQTLDLLGE